MDTTEFLRYIRDRQSYQGQIEHVEHLKARDAGYGQLDTPLPESLRDCLSSHGLSRLYTHQATAVNMARKGNNVMVATSSASGKTLCYNIPVMESVLNMQFSRALYLFPTKALTQDQLRTLNELFVPDLCQSVDFAVFDGDTPQSERAGIRKYARVVLTNPDMLHLGILPNHQGWSRFIRRLQYVVIDEAHMYRGVFGSHVANIISRLRRLCDYYGSNPQFICCSATIANPREHAESLTGVSFSVVDEDGSPSGGREFVFWNPPLVDTEKSLRRSANGEATTLFTELVANNIRTLLFTRTRRLTELIYSYAKRKLEESLSPMMSRIMPYRAGYLAEDRRRIEHSFFSGDLVGVVATSALEVGIDVGDLDATVLTGYPGSIASAWQQAGRSGRSREQALSFMIGLNNPLDQYFMRNPEKFFTSTYEYALINPANPYVCRDHLLCAAWEMALTGRDSRFFGESLTDTVNSLTEEGVLRERNGKWFVAPAIHYPAQSVNIRSTSQHSVSIINTVTNELLETLDWNTAYFETHPGAVYLHQGESYLVTGLDITSMVAYVQPQESGYYTQTRDFTDLRIIDVQREKRVGMTTAYLGNVEVTTTVVGYQKKQQYTDEVLGEEPLELPPQNFPTVAVWFDIPNELVSRLSDLQRDLAGSLHAAEHASIAMLPVFALCDRNDIGGVSTTLHPDTGQPQIFIYDAHPGGIGIAEKGFDLITELWQTTLGVIAGCPCEEGCPSCIQSPKCGNNNKPLDKEGACILLAGLVAGTTGTL